MAKNREIVPIERSNKNNRSAITIDASSVENFVLTAHIGQLVQCKNLCATINALEPEKQLEIYRFLLTKSPLIRSDNFNMQLFFNAAKAIASANSNAHEAVKEQAYTEVINILNNGLAINCKPKNHTNEAIKWNKSIEGVIDNLFLYNNFDKALSLARLSLVQRTKILLGENNPSSTTVADFLRSEQENQTSTPDESPKNQKAIIAYLQACSKIAELANHIVGINVRTEGLQQAVELYNVATICNQPEFRQLALILMANLHRLLGDNNKAATLAKLASNISSEDSNIIKKCGYTSPKTLEIKQQIKAETLDPIYQAAAIGKWTNMQPGRWYMPTEQGVTGYLPLTSDADYNTKMALIFESIVLAINNSETHDPTCAIIFAQKYPNIIKYAVEHHPEYFVNTDILRICAKKLDSEALQELTNNDEQNPSGYTSYQEKAVIPFIEKRLTTDNNIVQKVKELATGAWDDSTQTQLLTLFQDLKIGNNLGEISNSINIARSLLIKAVVNAITESKSVNFAPFQALCKQYPELIKEISAHHPGYLGNNKFILDITQQAVTEEKEPVILHHLEEEFSNITINTEPVDSSSHLTGQEGVSADSTQS